MQVELQMLRIVNCVLVHTDHLNNVPGQFIAEMNLDDIDKLEERWGSTEKVDASRKKTESITSWT